MEAPKKGLFYLLKISILLKLLSYNINVREYRGGNHMITVKVAQAIKLTTKESLFVSFQYDAEILAKVKSLPRRHYVPESKEWEVPMKDLDAIVTMFQDQEIKLIGKVKTKLTEKVAAVAKFAPLSIEAKNFTFKLPPFQHQIEGFDHGIKTNKYLLADEQGLGKTMQVISIAVARKKLFKHCLIVCGVNGLKWNWLAEVGIHSNETAKVIGAKLNKKGRWVDGTIAERLEELKSNISEFFITSISNH
jgi:SNF2 family DNA or RNA helicase